MPARRTTGALVLVLVAVAGAGGILLLRPEGAGEPETAAGRPTTASAPTAAASSPSPTASARAGSAVSATSSRAGQSHVDTLEPGPGVLVATDVPREVAAGTVTVELTIADLAQGSVEGAGYVDGVVEDGGTCTLTLTLGAQSVTAQSPGMADATTTICAGLSIDASQLAPGIWQAVLSYDSAAASGTSATTAVEVPAR